MEQWSGSDGKQIRRDVLGRGLMMAQASPYAGELAHGEEQRTALVMAGGDASLVAGQGRANVNHTSFPVGIGSIASSKIILLQTWTAV